MGEGGANVRWVGRKPWEVLGADDRKRKATTRRCERASIIKIGSNQQWVDRDCRRKAERQAAVFWDDKQGRRVLPFHMRHDPIRAPDIAPSIIMSITIIIMVAATTTEEVNDHHDDTVTVTVMSIFSKSFCPYP
jgi:hypothetical protein